MKTNKIFLFLFLTFSLNVFSQNSDKDIQSLLKEFYSRNNINSKEDIEDIEEIQTKIDLWDDMLILLEQNPSIETNSEFIEFKKNLIIYIDGYDPDIKIELRKSPQFELNDIYKKNNIISIKDIENFDELQDYINMWDDCQILLFKRPKLYSIFKPTIDELEFNINGLAPSDFSLKQRKEKFVSNLKNKNVNDNTNIDYLNSSYELAKEGKYQEAIDVLNKKTTLNDGDYAQIGKCYYFLKDYKNSLEFYTKAIQINPNKSVYYNNLAFVLKYYDTIGTIDKQILNINKAISLDPNDASYYITRANIETDMKGLKWSEENILDIRKINLNAYKSDFYDYSKAIELEPTNIDYRKLRVSFYKPLWNEDIYNNDPNMIFDIRESIIDDYLKIIELTNNEKTSLPYKQKLAELYEKLIYKNLTSDSNGNKLYNLKYADLSLSEFKKIYSIDNNENYKNDYTISNLFQILKKHKEAIQYFSDNINKENNENKKNNLILSLGKYYIWLSENNIEKSVNQNKAFIEFDKILTKLDNKILNSPNSLDLLAKRIDYTEDIGQIKYFEKCSSYFDKIIKIYNTDNTKCETLSFAYYLMIKNDKSKNIECYNESKKLIEIMADGDRAKQVVTMLTGEKKESFIEYYKKNKNLK